ncbi:MAG: methyltransferase domain-containing protein, partial [Actinobacteria bacterium]|nr:methyltransferase domain-containing protein [Actinomycetota bacterium]
GCGNGRLAVHAVQFLQQGSYVGIDIAPTFLAHAAQRLAPIQMQSTCAVRLVHQNDETFDVADHSVDVACAFSVFTHMEHEDMYRYLVQFTRIVRPGGRLIISCLPMTLDVARQVFRLEAELDPITRWKRVRNVTTSVDLVNEIVALAGWTVVRWLPGNEGQAPSSTGEMRALGQSVVVLTH